MLDSRNISHYTVPEQIQLLRGLYNETITVTFNHSDLLPRKEEIDAIISLLDQYITENDENQILIELQLVLVLALIQGMDLNQILQLTHKDWKSLGRTKQAESLTGGARNKYCDELVDKLNSDHEHVFGLLKESNVMQILNLFLVINGYEYALTAESLQILFGRYHYLKLGQIKSVREFLKKHFKVDSHIELLVQLKLVNTIHYNTMMRN